MKLVEILARKLKEWPEGAVSIAQDDDGRTWAYRGTPDRGTRQWLVYQGETEIDLIGGIEVGDADDRTIAIITRDQWQAERDRIAAIEEGIKAADAGKVSEMKEVKSKWRRHRGGRTPNSVTDRIDLRFRDGETSEFRCPSTIRWRHVNECDDVMAWRPSILKEKKQEMADSANSEIQSTYGPLFWRDSIREIDAAIDTENERHRSLMADLNSERAELVAKLAAEGLALCAVPSEVVEDMSDWRNWNLGDLVTVLDREGETEYENGNQYKIVFLEDKDYTGDCPAQLKNNDCCWLDLDNMRWHSRP